MADFHRVAEGEDGAEGIQHQVHAIANALSHRLYQADVLGHRSVLPGVDLEGAVAEFQALLREVGVGLRRVQSIGLSVADIGAGIGRECAALLTEELVDRHFEDLSRQIPQRHVHLRHAHAGVLTQSLFGVVVDLFPCERFLSQGKTCDHADRRMFGPAPPHILSSNTSIAEDPHNATPPVQGLALAVDGYVDRPLGTDVGQGVFEFGQLDLHYPRGCGHWLPSGRGIHLQIPI